MNLPTNQPTNFYNLYLHSADQVSKVSIWMVGVQFFLDFNNFFRYIFELVCHLKYFSFWTNKGTIGVILTDILFKDGHTG